MSSYSDYIMSASSSIADIVSTAGTAAASAAGQVAGQVSDACHTVASSAHQRLLSYKYEAGARPGGALQCVHQLEPGTSVYPDTDSPVWMLGHQLSAKYDQAELRDLVLSRPWMTYRKDFPAIGSSGVTSDQGWGCMLRCGQMVLAGALLDVRLGRGWRLRAGTEEHELDEPEYFRVMERFLDNKSSTYSIHQISLMGESVDKKPVGTWFGPNTVAQVLRKLCKYDPSNDICVHVAMDNALIISEVKQTCLQPVESSSEGEAGPGQAWRPLLLFVSLRLGLSDINPVYTPALKASFSLPSSLGVIGGSPNHALYLLGCVEEEVLYLDPHTTQPASQRVDASYHVPHPGRLPLTQLDPSLALCFLCITETEFDNLCIAIQETLIERCHAPLFEMMLERPAHMMYSSQPQGTDINVVPDDSTGCDYDQLADNARKYDSDNEEFEIL